MSGRRQGSYGHHIRAIGPDHYRLSWVVDFKYPSSRLRFPRSYDRDTDEAGANKFAKRWGLPAVSSKERGVEK